MFYYDYEAGYALQILYMDKLLFDHGKEPTGTDLDSDYFFEAFWEALQSCADDAERKCVYEDNGEELWTFRDPAITEYFYLCNEYGKRRHFRYRDNPYIKEMIKQVKIHMNQICSYSYDWDLRFKGKNGFDHRLLFAYNCEFYEYADAIKAILGVMAFFESGVKKLRAELGLTGGEILLLPQKQNALRGAA